MNKGTQNTDNAPVFGLPDELLPQTHIGLTQRSWQRIRAGLARCQANSEDCQRCLAWCRKFPTYTQTWIEILQGQHAPLVTLVFRIENYVDLPPDARDWWDAIIQNHPFAALFAHERYAALLARRKGQAN